MRLPSVVRKKEALAPELGRAMGPRGQLQPAVAWATKVETEECVLVPPFAVSWTLGGHAVGI